MINSVAKIMIFFANKRSLGCGVLLFPQKTTPLQPKLHKNFGIVRQIR